MPYLEIKKDEDGKDEVEIEVPNLIGLDIKEAKKILEELGLKIEEKQINESEDRSENSSKKIIEQLPKSGVKIKQNNFILVTLD